MALSIPHMLTFVDGEGLCGVCGGEGGVKYGVGGRGRHGGSEGKLLISKVGIAFLAVSSLSPNL